MTRNLRRRAAASLTLAALLAAPVAAEEAKPAPVAPQVAEAENDPFIWLEETKSERALAWVRAENEKTLAALTSDPRFETLKAESLAIFNATDRIPSVSFTPHGLINFWQVEQGTNGSGVLLRVCRPKVVTS